MRQELINSAVTFLNDSQVVNSPLAKRIEFLESKDMTSEEIEEALKRAKEGNNGGSSSSGGSFGSSTNSTQAGAVGYPSYPAYALAKPPLPKRDWRDYFIMATVSAGVGYGLYQVARRYVLPMILPPTPASLESDKEALEAEFARAQALLEQLQSDTKELKESEELRSENVDKALLEVKSAVDVVKSQVQQRDDDMKLIKSQIEGIRDSLPKALEKQKEIQTASLTDLQSELKSLKQLIISRSRVSAPMASIPSTASIVASIGQSSSLPTTAPASGGASSVGSPATSTAPLSSDDSQKLGEFPAPVNSLNKSKAGIPAWQLSAAEKSS